MGYVGGKAAARVKRRFLAASRATLVSGVVLLAYGLWRCARLGMAPSSLIPGLVLVTVGIAGLWLARRKAKARARTP
jgi:uncharacterized membrane protein YiaA